MQLEKALELISSLIHKDESFEPIGEVDSTPLPQGARKLEEDGGEVFFHIWQEPNGEWSVVTQVSLSNLHKDLCVSSIFDKALTKFRKKMLKGNLSVELQGKTIRALTAKSYPLTDSPSLVLQQMHIKLTLQEFVEENAKKLKLPHAFEDPDLS